MRTTPWVTIQVIEQPHEMATNRVVSLSISLALGDKLQVRFPLVRWLCIPGGYEPKTTLHVELEGLPTSIGNPTIYKKFSDTRR